MMVQNIEWWHSELKAYGGDHKGNLNSSLAEVNATYGISDNWNLSVDDSIPTLIARESRSLTFGARPTLRMINGILSLGVTNYQIEMAPLEEGSNINLELLSAENMRFKLSVEGGDSLEFQVDL